MLTRQQCFLKLNVQTLYLLLSALLLLGGCATNPVTGKQELSMMSTEGEIALGEENYTPMQQAQGGDYVTDPELSRYVNEVGKRLVKVSDRKLPYEFVVLNNSVPNAWALPGGKIAINRGLLVELKNEAELAAVLGHEIVHAAARHSAQKIDRSRIAGIGMIALGAAMGSDDNRGLIMMGAGVGVALLGQKYSREAESEADHYGMIYLARAGYDPRAAVALQETFVRLAKGKESNWLAGLFASHPPSEERVIANRKLAQELGWQGKRLGTKTYQAKIARLNKAVPAYKAHDDGRKALKENNLDKALQLADKAIRIDPKEGLFYSLKGDVYQKKGQADKAKSAYDQAIKYNADFFYFYLQRGLIEKQRGNTAAARRDLEKSYRLLPTKTAQQALQDLS